MRRFFLLIVALVAGLAAIRAARGHLLAEPPGPRPRFESFSVPDSAIVAAASMGYRQLAADFFWLLAVQHYGAAENAEEGYPGMYPLLDLVTDLDPNFAYAYRFGGITVPYHHPTRGWLRAEQAETLLDKGLKHRPDVWQIGQLLGYLRYWHFSDSRGAASAMAAAAKVRGCPNYVGLLATRLLSEARNPETGLQLATDLLEETEDPKLREELSERIRMLECEIVLQRVEAAIEAFRRTHGTMPARLDDLVAAGLLPELPPDPLGAGITYEAATGRVASAAMPQRLFVAERARRALKQEIQSRSAREATAQGDSAQ